jgi:hypothetical protein
MRTILLPIFRPGIDMRRERRAAFRAAKQIISFPCQGRGCGVGRALGVGAGLGVTAGVGVAVAVALGVGVTVGVTVAVAVGVGVGVGPAGTAQYLPPVLISSDPSSPAQTIISLPVQTAV